VEEFGAGSGPRASSRSRRPRWSGTRSTSTRGWRKLELVARVTDRIRVSSSAAGEGSTGERSGAEPQPEGFQTTALGLGSTFEPSEIEAAQPRVTRWQEVAQTALDFVKRFVPAKPTS